MENQTPTLAFIALCGRCSAHTRTDGADAVAAQSHPRGNVFNNILSAKEKLLLTRSRALSDHVPVAYTEDSDMTKTPIKKPKPVGGPTAFSDYCKANKIDGVKARRKLRALKMSAPYDPTDKRVLAALKSLQSR